VFEKIKQARRNARERVDLTRLIEDCKQLLTERGEGNSVVIAGQALEHYSRLSTEAAQRFFEILASDFDPDPGEVLMLAERYAVTRSPENLIRLSKAAEPPRQELLRRLNRAPGGTGSIVQMRAKLLDRLKHDRKLSAVDSDFEHLLSSWFNPGFLKLVKVDWSSAASLLERIIQHEAVHEIDGWNDLRRRLEPDRRCFAFFHPVLPDEPLIFVEVALLAQMPAAIAPLLDRSVAEDIDPEKFKVAAFYSISNCQPGLRGVNLGNFLIKRVAERLQQEHPGLKTFCTLSPIPSFAAWLTKVERIESKRLKPPQLKSLQDRLAALRQRHGRDLAGLHNADLQERDHEALKALCAFFLAHLSAGTATEPAGASDPVARFHLNNGARLERINGMADLSRKAMRQSYGLMVNYLYDLEEIEANHQKFMNGEVSASRAVLMMN
jgi:malonyl-CoA decarboxylase